MKEFVVGEVNNKKGIVSLLRKEFPKLNQNTIFKALRNKDIRVNDVKIKEDIVVHTGDRVKVFIIDDLLFGRNSFFDINEKDVAYNDANFIIYNKPIEIEVQGNDKEIGLEEALKKHFKCNFLKACHRLDRNTCGLVIFAKNETAEKAMLGAIKKHQVRKFYKAHVYGDVKVKENTLTAYLFKDSKKSNVIVSDSPKKGYSKIITKYRLLKKYKDGSSLLEVEIITGKTHQIRAHLAHIGLPIIGDGKYGKNEINKVFEKKYQELQSYKLIFEIDDSNYGYLNDYVIEV